MTVGRALEGVALDGSTLGAVGRADDGTAVVGEAVGSDGEIVGAIEGSDVGGNGSHCLFAST